MKSIKERKAKNYPAAVMPLQNGTQKELGLDPDFRRDDGKGRDDGTVVLMEKILWGVA
jgi:hypothetical protein